MTVRSVLGVAVLIALTGCSGSSDPDSSEPDAAGSTAEQPTDEITEPAVTTQGGSPSTDAEPATSTTLRPGVVAFEGSVEDLLGRLDEASNFAAGVEAWLGDVPGQEGVLRNSRGVTLFVPADVGFSPEDGERAFASPNRSALTLSDHLRVGVLEELDGPVVVSSGNRYRVTTNDDGDVLVAGRRVIATETAANGVIHLLDGPLGSDG